VQGHSSGADVVLLGEPHPALRSVLEEVCAPARSLVVEGSVPSVLRVLADVASEHRARPLVLARGDLDVDLPAVLDLLDRPGVATATVTVEPGAVDRGLECLSPVRVGRDGKGVESVGTAAHVVTNPTHVLLGLVRTAPGDRAVAATLWRAAAEVASPAWGPDLAAAAVLPLVRGGVRVQSSLFGPFRWSTAGAGAAGAPGDAWRQRLRGASRGGDGFFSTFAVRPLSRRLTAIGLRHGWTPNVVTLVSLACGIAAAALVATGWWWAWVLGAVLLMGSLVVDCVDGEIARYTRRFSPLGAFLDAVGDRVKEYSVLAAVAAVAVREGMPGWPVAVAAMAAVTVRHLEDYAYEDRLSYSRRSRPDLLEVAAARDLGGPDSRTTLPPRPTRRQRVVHWTKKVIHLPIAERYLLISLTLLTGRPMVVLWTLLVAVVIAVVWTQGGRVAFVLLRRDPTWSAVAAGEGPGHLDHQLDLGPVARVGARVLRGPFWVGLVGAAVLAVGPVVALWQGSATAALGCAVVGGLLVGAAWHPPMHHPLAWQAPAALWVAEVAMVATLVHHTVGVMSAAAFAYLAAIAYHRYDVVYRLRDTGSAPGAWLSPATLGTEGRMVLVLVAAVLVPDQVVTLLWVAAVLLALVYLAESATGWSRWIRARSLDSRPEAD
jgi:phosphatidylglycerophosphate synthase